MWNVSNVCIFWSSKKSRKSAGFCIKIYPIIPHWVQSFHSIEKNAHIHRKLSFGAGGLRLSPTSDKFNNKWMVI